MQLCLEFLGFSDVVLKIINLPMRVKEDRLSLKQNKFERESIETRAKNRSRRGSTNSTNSFTKTKFEYQNKACKGTSK